MFGVHFLCLWAAACAVKEHQVSFHTPFLNHTIVFWDKIRGRTLALPGICWNTGTAGYFKCPPPLLFCSVISLILLKWCCYLCLPAQDEMAKLPPLLDCGLQIPLCYRKFMWLKAGLKSFASKCCSPKNNYAHQLFTLSFPREEN